MTVSFRVLISVTANFAAKNQFVELVVEISVQIFAGVVLYAVWTFQFLLTFDPVINARFTVNSVAMSALFWLLSNRHANRADETLNLLFGLAEVGVDFDFHLIVNFWLMRHLLEVNSEVFVADNKILVKLGHLKLKINY